MGIALPQLLTGHVMHKRLLPKAHAFRYGIYYVALPLSKLALMDLPYNRFGLLSFYDKDHGDLDGGSLDSWARNILKQHQVHADGEITLVCMPRVCGYVFNPVSFWFCQDKEGQLKAVLCEVHNTFGEQHTYICAHPDHRGINAFSPLFAKKIFHVSPFLAREGQYEFRFDLQDDSLNVVINLHDARGHKQLVTALNGEFKHMNKASLRQVFWRYPLVTIKAIFMIHWHALKLVLKGIKYISKPKQLNQTISKTY